MQRAILAVSFSLSMISREPSTTTMKLSLSISREVRERYAERREYDDVDIAYSSLGDFESAIENHQKQLSITKSMGDRAGRVSFFYMLRGNYKLVF